MGGATLTPLASQWTERVIAPVLRRLGLHSEAAVQLLVGTVAVESAFQWLAQWPRGPGLGFYQIEPETAHDILRRLPPRCSPAMSTFLGAGTLAEELVWNLAFQTAVARVKYYLIPAPLPSAGNLPALAHYWLKYYNGGGKGTTTKFLESWGRLVEA